MRIIIIFIAGILLSGCRIVEIGANEVKYEYTLKILNKTGFDIEIETFVKGVKYDVISIKNKDSYSKKKV